MQNGLVTFVYPQLVSAHLSLFTSYCIKEAYRFIVFSIASEKFHHGSNHEANAVGKANNAEHKDELRLARVGECVLSEATSATSERIWYCNDEKAAPRQVHEAAAFFHFHHWDEFVAMRYVTWTSPPA